MTQRVPKIKSLLSLFRCYTKKQNYLTVFITFFIKLEQRQTDSLMIIYFKFSENLSMVLGRQSSVPLTLSGDVVVFNSPSPPPPIMGMFQVQQKCILRLICAYFTVYYGG